MMKRATNSAPLPDSVIARIRDLVDSEGEPAALAALRISRPTLGRACSGLPVQHATRYMIEQRAAQLAKVSRVDR
jgi:hypothetical protein